MGLTIAVLMSELTFRTLHFESLPSTNTELVKLAVEGAAEGLCIIADEQTAGRGRLLRTWSSPKGAGLYASFLLRPQISLHLWPLITFVAALSVGDALLEAFGVETEIKWPNDLLSGERKICGILSEAVDTPAGRAAIVGIGINLTSQAYPPELTGVATAVAEESAQAADRNVVLQSLQKAIGVWYEALRSEQGRDEILQSWINRSPYVHNKLVDVINGGETFRGVTRGVELDGALRVETSDGGLRIVRAGDVIHVRSVKADRPTL